MMTERRRLSDDAPDWLERIARGEGFRGGGGEASLSRACKHRSGWGTRWTGGRYCLGCGLPYGVIVQQLHKQSAALLDAALAVTPRWRWRERRGNRRARARLDSLLADRLQSGEASQVSIRDTGGRDG